MSLPAYPDYTDSGVPWLGEVPTHWKVLPLKWLLDANDGGVWGDDPDGEDDTIVLRSTEQTVGGQWHIDDPAPRKLSAAEREKAMLRVGDLLVTKSSGSSLHIGKTTLVDEGVTALRACYSNFMQRLTPSNRLSSRLAWYFLNSSVARKQLDVLSNSTIGLANLNGTILGLLETCLPPKEEQAAIAAFLDRETAKIDALVAEQQRLIALLKEKRQAFISHSVTKGLNPHAPMNDSGIEWLGEIPAHWEVSRLDRLMSFSSGKAHEPFIDEDGEHVCISARFVSTQGQSVKHCTKNLTPAFPGDVVMVMSDLPNGRALARAYQIPDDGESYAVNQRVCRLSNFRGCGRYFLYQLNRNEGLLWYNDGVNQTHLSNAAYCKLALCNPPVEEQQSIADCLDEITSTFDLLTTEAQAAIILLQERRAAMIAAAVTGKIDVCDLVSTDNVVSIETARPSQPTYTIHGVVGALAIAKLGKLGRMAVMKGGFLAEAHAGITEMGGRYERAAAGPYSRAVVQAMEQDASAQFGITVRESDSRIEYAPPSDLSVSRDALRELVGPERAANFISLLALLKDLGRKPVEAIATLYAAWNDLLAQHGTTTDDAVINEVLNDWDAEKAQKFKRSDLENWLTWMRRNHIVPDGTGPRTDHQVRLF